MLLRTIIPTFHYYMPIILNIISNVYYIKTISIKEYKQFNNNAQNFIIILDPYAYWLRGCLDWGVLRYITQNS